jgi:rod shape determining protein RodA
LRPDKSIFNHLDWLSVLLFAVLVLMGWINIYAAVYNEEFSSIFDTTQRYGKQLMFIGGTVFIIIIILFTDGRIYEKLAWPIYVVILFMLAAVLLIGKEIGGAKAWFSIGSFGLQPAELAKFATSLAIAKYLSAWNVSMNSWRNRFVVIGILAVPSVLIAMQPDMGSVLVYGAFVLVMYREGLPGYYIFLGFWLVILFVVSLLLSKATLFISIGVLTVLAILYLRKQKGGIKAAIIGGILSTSFVLAVDKIFNDLLAPHQQSRFLVLLGLEEDPMGVGYNTRQSLIAIGSGGFKGKGFLQGTQTKYDFVPEQSTDYIFCTIGEEWGFIGTSVVVILFMILLFRLVMIAERQKTDFARIYGYCVVSILFFHVAINVAMVIGLAPVIGIPLPFFSYGGSSLWAFTVLLFILLKMDQHRWQIL